MNILNTNLLILFGEIFPKCRADDSQNWLNIGTSPVNVLAETWILGLLLNISHYPSFPHSSEIESFPSLNIIEMANTVIRRHPNEVINSIINGCIAHSPP
jgi:hypothetical protein